MLSRFVGRVWIYSEHPESSGDTQTPEAQPIPTDLPGSIYRSAAGNSPPARPARHRSPEARSWHGQSQVRSAVFHATSHPRCVQIGERSTTSPSSLRICRNPRPVSVENLSLAALYRAQCLSLRACKAVANQVVGIVLVLSDVIPRAAQDPPAAQVRTGPPTDSVAPRWHPQRSSRPACRTSCRCPQSRSPY